MAEISYKLEILKEAVSRTRARPSPGGKENDDDLQARQISGLFDACMMYGDDERTDRKYREVADTLFSHWGDQNYDLAHRARELLGYTEKVKDRIFFKAVNWNDNNLERAALHIDKTRKRLNAEVIFDDQLPEGLVSRAKAKDRGSIATNVGLELASLISGEVVANITPLGNVHNDMALILIAIASLAPVWTGIVVKGIENTKLLDKTGTSMIYPAKVLYDRFQSVSKKAQQIGANVGYYGYQLPFELVYFITAYMEGDFKKGAALLIAANIVSAAELTAQIVGSRKHRLGYQKANVDPFIVSE